jgi:hypothetical protein
MIKKNKMALKPYLDKISAYCGPLSNVDDGDMRLKQSSRHFKRDSGATRDKRSADSISRTMRGMIVF